MSFWGPCSFTVLQFYLPEDVEPPCSIPATADDEVTVVASDIDDVLYAEVESKTESIFRTRWGHTYCANTAVKDDSKCIGRTADSG